MSEDTSTNVEQTAQTTEADSNVDYKTLYHQEVKNSKSQRGKKQELESKMEQLELKSEEDRQAKMIAEGKKDELLQEQSSRLKALEKELGLFKQAEDSQKAKLLEQIPEDDRMYYENMNIEQLQHFLSKSAAQPVNPPEAVQGRSVVDSNMNDYMKKDTKYQRDNYAAVLQKYAKNSRR
jgi:hypothetical protein